LIGMNTDPSANNGSDQIVIGYGATGQGDDTAVIGNASVTAVYMAEDSGATVYAAGLNLGGTAVSSTAAELNLLDGGTSVGSSITVADSDGIIMNDGGEMKTIPASDLKTYVQSATSLDDLSDAKSGGTNFSDSMILGHTTTGTLTNAAQNTAVGIDAMKSITGGDDNTAVGFEALQNKTTTSRTTAVGSKALWNSSGNDNTAVGYQASYANSSGQFNVAIGSEALYSNLTSSQNLAIGRRALYSMTSSGQYNTAIGYYAGMDGNSNTAITGGDNNVLIGHQSGVDNANAQNRIVIGQGARGLADDSVVLGNTDVTAVYMAQDSGATVYAGGLNLSGGTTVSGVKFGTVTMSTNAEQAFTISGVTSNSIVTASFKSGDNGRYIQKVVPSTDTITITLDNPADGGVIMYIIIN